MKEITSLDEIKSIELSIMKKIHKLCEEEGIVYYLSFGSLIGAVRHNGFIPWDDDIDLYLPRPDYNKLVKIIKKKGPQMGLNYANPFSKIHYGRNLTKVFDTTTYLIEPDYRTDDPIGVFVDLWPLDGTPNNRILRKIYLVRAHLKKKVILASSMKYNDKYSILKKMEIRVAGVFNHSKLVRSMERMARKYSFNKSEYVFSYAAQDAVYKRELFNKRILWKFEDTELYIPAEYDKILRLEFGDYMKLPPIEQRVAHHVVNTYYK